MCARQVQQAPSLHLHLEADTSCRRSPEEISEQLDNLRTSFVKVIQSGAVSKGSCSCSSNTLETPVHEQDM